MVPNKYSAFTIIEIVVVLAIMSMILLVAAPVGLNQLHTSNAESSARDIASNLFLMQQNAYNFKDSAQFGLTVQGEQIYIYEGTAYASAVWSEKIELRGNPTISISLVSGGNSIDFAEGSLLPNTNGAINVSTYGVTYSVSINSEGLIDITRI